MKIKSSIKFIGFIIGVNALYLLAFIIIGLRLFNVIHVSWVLALSPLFLALVMTSTLLLITWIQAYKNFKFMEIHEFKNYK